MKILLTGGAGFLGSNLAVKLTSLGHQLTVIDDLSTGSLENLQPLLDAGYVSFIEHDIRVPFQTDVDFILNFACPASPIHYQADPVKTMETNFLGVVNMLHLARESGAKLLQASTSEIYGDPIESPQTEGYWGNVNPIGLRSCYDEGKRAAETLCFDYFRQYNVDTRVIRIFNTYGPGMAVGDGRVVSNFIVQALRNEDITIYGDGKQTRSFCFVDDLVAGIVSLIDLDFRPERPINLGNPNEFTMLELAQLILKVTNSKSQLVFKDLPSDDPRQRKPDISLAKKLLDWEPKIELLEGVAKTARYFSDQI
ncbi:WcaG Nucleoside-diphosphate-sugar epimerases [Candidatus Nanopelagicaceae bacterium]